MRKVLKMVNIQPDYLMRYPHEFSGGQRQRLHRPLWRSCPR